MGILVTNDATTTLAAGVSALDTAFSLTSGTKFPTYTTIYPTVGYDYSYAVVEDTLHNIEIVKIVNRVGALVTVQRAQEGTTALAFPAGSAFEIRATAQTVIDLANGLTPADIGVTVQAYDADTAKTGAANVWTADQTLGAGHSLVFEGTVDDASEGALTATTITADRTWTLPDKSGTIAMTSDIAISGITLGTPVATTSGTAIDYTSIPSGVKRITINPVGVSGSGTSNFLIQIGDSGGIKNTGYVSSAGFGTTNVGSTAGFVVTASNGGTNAWHGSVVLTLQSSAAFTWSQFGNLNRPADNTVHSSAGSKSLSAELDRIRITTVNGTDTFDAGSINISFE